MLPNAGSGSHGSCTLSNFGVSYKLAFPRSWFQDSGEGSIPKIGLSFHIGAWLRFGSGLANHKKHINTGHLLQHSPLYIPVHHADKDIHRGRKWLMYLNVYLLRAKIWALLCSQIPESHNEASICNICKQRVPLWPLSTRGLFIIPTQSEWRVGDAQVGWRSGRW